MNWADRFRFVLLVAVSATVFSWLGIRHQEEPPTCYRQDIGNYTGVLVGSSYRTARYVHTGGRLADDDPRWRAWGKLWATCR